MSSPVITLLSDFGLQDEYVAVMKGVILEICPAARLIDISHLIAPQDVRSAAFLLFASIDSFREGQSTWRWSTPGWGPTKAGSHQDGVLFFVGPDNGLFSLIVKKETGWEARRLENPRFGETLSAHVPWPRYFRARSGSPGPRGSLRPAGVRLRPCFRTLGPTGRFKRHMVKGEVIHIDRFGIALTNVTIEVLEKMAPAKKWAVLAGRSAVSIP